MVSTDASKGVAEKCRDTFLREEVMIAVGGLSALTLFCELLLLRVDTVESAEMLRILGGVHYHLPFVAGSE